MELLLYRPDSQGLLVRARDFSLSTSSRPTIGPNQCTQLVPGTLFLKAKWLGHKVDHPSATSVHNLTTFMKTDTKKTEKYKSETL
jgi:hypothetical protein